MGFWSKIADTAGGIVSGTGFYVKNGIKVGAGYGIGNLLNDTAENLTGHSIDPAVAGIAGAAAVYLVPKITSDGDENKKSVPTGWKGICRKATIAAGLLFGAGGIAKWSFDKAKASDNIHDPLPGEYLHTGLDGDIASILDHGDGHEMCRSLEGLTDDIEAGTSGDGYEFDGM